MKIAGYFFGGLLGLAGLVFLIAAGQGNALPRVVIGVILIGAGLFVSYVVRMKAPQTTLVQKIDLSGDIAPEQLRCKACGGMLEKDSITVKAGGIFIDCPYCGASYQLEEEPKW